MTPSGLSRWLAGFCATVAALIKGVAQKPDNHRDKLNGDWAVQRLFVTTSPERRKSQRKKEESGSATGESGDKAPHSKSYGVTGVPRSSSSATT